MAFYTYIVASRRNGTIYIGMTISGDEAVAGTIVTGFGTGTGGAGSYSVNINQTADGPDFTSSVAPGGAGTYGVSQSQTLGSQILASGAMLLQQNAKVTFQLDFHSPDTTAGDFAQTVSTAFRDDYATQLFVEQYGAVAIPLYADDPRQSPFVNDQNAYEFRPTVDCCLQVNQIFAPAFQFADSLHANVASVAAEFPAS